MNPAAALIISIHPINKLPAVNEKHPKKLLTRKSFIKSCIFCYLETKTQHDWTARDLK